MLLQNACICAMCVVRMRFTWCQLCNFSLYLSLSLSFSIKLNFLGRNTTHSIAVDVVAGSHASGVFRSLFHISFMWRMRSFFPYAHKGNELLNHYFGWIMGNSAVDNAEDTRWNRFKDCVLLQNKLRVMLKSLVVSEWKLIAALLSVSVLVTKFVPSFFFFFFWFMFSNLQKTFNRGKNFFRYFSLSREIEKSSLNLICKNKCKQNTSPRADCDVWRLKTRQNKKQTIKLWKRKKTTDKVNLHIIGRWCGIFSVWPQHIADCSRFSIVISMMHDAQIVHKSNWILLNGIITQRVGIGSSKQIDW